MTRKRLNPPMMPPHMAMPKLKKPRPEYALPIWGRILTALAAWICLILLAGSITVAITDKFIPPLFVGMAWLTTGAAANIVLTFLRRGGL